MLDWIDICNMCINSATLALTALALLVAVVMPDTERWNRRFFVCLFTIIMLCLSFTLADLFVYKDPTMRTAEMIIAYCEYLLLSLSTPLFTAYLLRSCGESIKSSWLFSSVMALWFFSFCLLFIAQFTNFIYYFTPNNEFVRGSWHHLLMASIVLPMLMNLVGVIRRREKLPPKHYTAFLIYLLPITASLIVHTFYIVYVLVFVGESLSSLSMFAIILYDHLERYVDSQRKIANQRASIMVLEMRPHFIYNAMMSIYYLCAKDPKKAQEVTLDFTTYLRKNFTAIASEDTIPFADELEHTKAYLAVEQVQFEEGLIVEFDTPHKDFRLPPLTLQPIVENAVKHGMDPEYAPLKIIIRTRETDEGSEIIVEDSGPGFLEGAADANAQSRSCVRTSASCASAGRKQSHHAPLPALARPCASDYDKNTHTALTNIRERLLMHGGNLKIRPREEGGTVVTVTIAG